MKRSGSQSLGGLHSFRIRGPRWSHRNMLGDPCTRDCRGLALRDETSTNNPELRLPRPASKKHHN
ncbi:hypothetical protein BS47DRAFT_1340104, partial [Hydnum rufescens UP504]